MNPESQRKEIGNSLRATIEVFESCDADYRIIGSTLIVAHTNKVFRRINDVDIILDIQSKNYVFEKLKNNGFLFENKKAAGFSWIEAKKDGHLGLTFFLVGEFNKDYFIYHFNKFLALRVKSDYLKPTEYIFDGIKFVGIPISSAIAGIRQSFLNPKRKLDKEVLKIEIQKTKVKTYNNIYVYIFGIKIPYLYDLFSFFYNIYGGLRVIFGRKYEFWD
ncbi:MAG: hypothetical protein EXS48_02505 [Candidatus Staskawiczbacteria bacterium]|nr:hypothetical protein [Candidatus Staskawiczbacteria bacterium]